MDKNRFLGWHKLGKYEIFGLFQKVSDSDWWFCGPGEGMSFMADISSSRKATLEEIKNLVEIPEK